MSLQACADIVHRGDPDRFRTVMAAPLSARERLLPLYAFNVEVSRAPWVTAETMIAEMRLQWWRDALEEIAAGRQVRSHEVTTPLAAVLTPDEARLLDEFVAARRWDIYRDAFEDEGHFEAYIDQTAGHLMWVAAKGLGAANEAEIRALAYAAGVAAFLRAVPALEAAGRIPLIDGTHAGLRRLARAGLEAVAKGPKRAGPALWPAMGARATFRQVLRDPAAVAEGRLEAPVSSWRLARASVLGRV